MNARRALISGAGVAGPTLAYWLARHGFHVTVVERARDLRSSGNPVDVRGPALAVAERMGIVPRLRRAATGNTGLTFVNAQGRRLARMDMSGAQRAGEIELPRGDLASILYETARDHAEFLFDDSIATLRQDGHGVEVTFERAEPRRFDLVIGADGLHSATRRLAFGAEGGLVRHMGLYVATTPLGGPGGPGRDVLMHNTPGKAIAVSPTPGGDLAFFLYRSPAEPGFDHRDTEQHKRMLARAYADVSWRAPELLKRVRAADDLYFDSVSRVVLPRWSNGRVALLGDAASCVSLFGDGSTLAMAGAFTLAEELAAAPADDPRAAFRRYESIHRGLVDPKQRAIGQAAALIVPATRPGILARNLLARLWPVMAAVSRLRSTPSGPRAQATA
jgi:2-polyprenyl-6-methoxyphenol hydroxylase-like FAD-dependent oxidoreductase